MLISFHTPGRVYFKKSYVGWDPQSPALDAMLCEAKNVASHHADLRRANYGGSDGGALHITLVTPPEIRDIRRRAFNSGAVLSGNEEDLAAAFVLASRHNDPGPTIDLNAALIVHEYPDRDGGVEIAHTLPVWWPAMQGAREAICKLPPKDFHFTLGIERRPP